MTFRLKKSQVCYADDICCGTQARTFTEVECTLTVVMARITYYCHKWCLKPSVTKTVSSVFNLHNANANRELKITMDENSLRHDSHPVYLGVTLDRTLGFGQHLSKTSSKLKSRNNLLSKLAGSTWGAVANTLRTSAPTIRYSIPEYCAPVCDRSPHINDVDTQLNASMRIITGNCLFLFPPMAACYLNFLNIILKSILPLK